VSSRPAVLSDTIAVLGASLAGLFVAAAAAGAGRQVTILERDPRPDGPVWRPGVPQGRQAHVLLYRGLVAMEELLPGLRRQLLDAGAVPFDTGDLAWLGEYGWMPVGIPGFGVVSATRPLLEDVVRRRVAALPGVEISYGTRVKALSRTPTGWRVHFRREAGAANGAGEEEAADADLVVDASGRTSRLRTWLPLLGIQEPRYEAVDARVGYAARLYARGSEGIGVPGIILLATPDVPRGAVALPVEADRWLVGEVGFGADRPPRDPAGFEAFLNTLRDPAIAGLAERCEPVSDVFVHRQTANERHVYERVGDWPDGLLVVGDALAAFNPIYGQGITVAAIEALLLRRALAGGLRRGSAARLMDSFAAVVRLPWAIATGEDVRFPTADRGPSGAQRLLRSWTAELTVLAVHGDRRAARILTGVYHLMAPPVLLFHPQLFASAAQARVRGQGPAAPRPQGLPHVTSAR
jgi:2-polyprenyl-6-methoxyphenol hydroxylase-like FAD-dependent oxidoreductase